MSKAVPSESHPVEPTKIDAHIAEAAAPTQSLDSADFALGAERGFDAFPKTSGSFMWPEKRGCLIVACVLLFQEVDHNGFRCAVALSALTALVVERIGGLCALQRRFPS
ncbi:unnamed protein product [Phytomonas sp. Hart1]|nr:unnamed protein product [Phytomonas sp. Hart1]|eukprot:CCW70856.1 unnamed protein product [Phytomonas sp. isolate Hart1]